MYVAGFKAQPTGMNLIVRHFVSWLCNLLCQTLPCAKDCWSFATEDYLCLWLPPRSCVFLNSESFSALLLGSYRLEISLMEEAGRWWRSSEGLLAAYTATLLDYGEHSQMRNLDVRKISDPIAAYQMLCHHLGKKSDFH